MSPLRKVINTANPYLTPHPPKGGVLNNEQFAKVPFPRVAIAFRERHSYSALRRRQAYGGRWEALAEAQGDLGVILLFGVDSSVNIQYFVILLFNAYNQRPK